MTGYTKLFGSILASSVWGEPDHVRVVWVTMLAMANKDGIVEASLPGLAHIARVSLENTADAIQRFTAPDPYSRTKDFDGRRIEAVDGGWRILNHRKYREKLNADERRAYLAEKQREHRAKQSPVNTCQHLSTLVNNRNGSSTPSTQAEAEAEAEARRTSVVNSTLGVQGDVAEPSKPRSGVKRPPRLTDEEFLKECESSEAFRGINIRQEAEKMRMWCGIKGKMPTRARLLSWLSRADRPLNGGQRELTDADHAKGF